MFNWKKKDKENNKKQNKNLGDKLKELFLSRKIDESLFEDLEDLLIESDIGGSVSMEIVDELKVKVKTDNKGDSESLTTILRDILIQQIKSVELPLKEDHLNIFLLLGVNGVGKTTTISKLANYYKKKGINDILLSAGDTFRAAAVEQLKIHGEKNGLKVIHQEHGADPSAVIFDTITSAKANDNKLILADTAGRMHNRTNLIKELQKIDRVITNKLNEKDNYKKILVIDSTTGQNGLQQAEIFHSAIDIDGIVLTKYDSTAKGGNIISISRKLGIPFVFIGHGEGLEDLSLFNRESFLDDLLLRK